MTKTLDMLLVSSYNAQTCIISSMTIKMNLIFSLFLYLCVSECIFNLWIATKFVVNEGNVYVCAKKEENQNEWKMLHIASYLPIEI